METNKAQWLIALLHSERDREIHPCKDYKDVKNRAEKYFKDNQPRPGAVIGVMTGFVDPDGGHSTESMEAELREVQQWIANFAEQMLQPNHSEQDWAQ